MNRSRQAMMSLLKNSEFARFLTEAARMGIGNFRSSRARQGAGPSCGQD
jgi:hypothetical protein